MIGTTGRAERACLALADISGYSTYLQGVELDHARDVIADLLTAIVTPFRSHFHLNKLEGDAAFLYCPTEEIDGSLLLDMIEASYFGFRRRVRSIERATTCNCGACALIPRLDLKMLIHHGTVAHQEMLGLDELVGPDVVLIHRLLKNDIEETTGYRAYALLTDSTLMATGLEPELLDMVPFEAEFADVGLQRGWVHDLDRAWRKEQARRRFYVAPGEALFTMEHFIPGIEMGLAWEWLTRAELRLKWETGFDQVIDIEGMPRKGVGSETHCVHGEGAIKEEVIDWRPPRYVSYRGKFASGEAFVLTDELVEQEGGVLVRKNLQPASADDREAVTAILEQFKPIMEGWFPLLGDLLTAEMRRRATVPEPEIPTPDEAERLATTVQ